MNLAWMEKALKLLSPGEFLFVINQAEAKYGTGVKIKDIKQSEDRKIAIVELPSHKLGIIKIEGSNK